MIEGRDFFLLIYTITIFGFAIVAVLAWIGENVEKLLKLLKEKHNGSPGSEKSGVETEE